MPIEISVPVASRVGTFTTPNKKISSALARVSLTCTVQIPLPDREDPTKSITFSIEQSTDRSTWRYTAGFTWEGGPYPPPPPGVPEKPYHDPGITFDLSEFKGYWIRATIITPMAMQCGLTITSTEN